MRVTQALETPARECLSMCDHCHPGGCGCRKARCKKEGGAPRPAAVCSSCKEYVHADGDITDEDEEP